MLFVLPFRTEHSAYFILIKVCHFVGRLKHKYNVTGLPLTEDTLGNRQ